MNNLALGLVVCIYIHLINAGPFPNAVSASCSTSLTLPVIVTASPSIVYTDTSYSFSPSSTSNAVSETLVPPSTTKYPFTLNDCAPAQDPDEDLGETVCQCLNWIGNLPLLASSGSSMCAYSTLTAAPETINTTKSPVKTTTTSWTSTLSNEGEIEYWGVMTTAGAAGPWPQSFPLTSSTSMLYSGKHMEVHQVTTTSANVGILTGMPLYTSVSNALLEACTATPAGGPSGSVTTCGEAPKITGIIWTDGDCSWSDSAELEMEVKYASYYDMESLHGMVASLASALNTSSLNPDNRSSYPKAIEDELGQGECWGLDGYGFDHGAPDYITNVPGWIEVIFTQDTAEAHDWPVQNMVVELSTSKNSGSDFICADGALVADGLAALSLIPGLEFLAFMAAPALGVSAICDGTEHSNEGGE